MSQIAEGPQGHTCYVARQERSLNFIMMCSGCGKYSESNVKKLKEGCHGFRRDGDRTQRRLLCAGKHPKSTFKD
eukprot:9467398-Pyramimonas_sp.AAC.1